MMKYSGRSQAVLSVVQYGDKMSFTVEGPEKHVRLDEYQVTKLFVQLRRYLEEREKEHDEG